MLNKSKTITFLALLLSTLLLLTACFPSKIHEEIEKTEKENLKIKEEKKKRGDLDDEEITVENVELSKEQKEALSKIEKRDVKEIVLENDLDVHKELDIQVPDKKKEFEDPEEFSQYISYILFNFYRGELEPEAFLNELMEYAHPDFIELLPKSRENRIQTFKSLQELYISQLHSPIEKYVITDIHFHERAREATFYRKYTLKSYEELYYITVLKEEDGVWKLLDDSPSPPYEATILGDFNE